MVVLSSKDIARSGELNLSNALVRIYPSITMSARGSNTNSLVSSIQMRGLGPNETLVLVDGKRRHATANIVQKPGPQFASSGVDLNMIPADMIDHIEVLEDGAAAMYGSDAIAGVVNIITKKKDHGLTLSGQTGANAYRGDGVQFELDADGGFKLGDDGYVHIAAQVFHSDHSITWGSDHALLGRWPAGADTKNYFVGVKPNSQGWAGRETDYLSTPKEMRETLGVDAAKSINSHVELYGQSTFGYRHAEMRAYKSPYVVPGYFPDGLRPITGNDELDYGVTLGVKMQELLGFDWDVSTTYGGDSSRISIRDVVNIGMLNATGFSPTKFWDYTQKNSQLTNNLDLRRKIAIGAMPVGLALGAEHRMDSYEIVSGNPQSYLYGGPVEHVGIPPQSAGTWYRNVWAGYADVNLRPVRKLQIDIAGRYEYYTDSESTANGKVSARYDFTPNFALRGTISNGFRAPTLQESHFSRLNVYPGSVGGQLPVDSAGARSLGASSLRPERSTNVSAGFVAQPLPKLNVEVDVYQINLRDRIVQGGTVKGQRALSAIQSFGFDVSPTANNIANSSAYYLSNGASTRTQGLDARATYPVSLHRYGTVNLGAALNLNRTRLHHNGTSTLGAPLLNDRTIAWLTTATPRSKLILSATWLVDRWDVTLRQSRYGETTAMMSYEDWTPASATCPRGGALRYSNSCFAQFKNTPRWVTDLDIGYQITKNLHASVGANNIFDIRPRQLPGILTPAGGSMFDQFSGQIPFSGGYYFGRLTANF